MRKTMPHPEPTAGPGIPKPKRQGPARLSFRAKTIIALSGTGLALWICLAVGLIFNARIAVENEVVSSFSVTLRYVEARRNEIAGAIFSENYLGSLGLESGAIRHVRASVIDSDGRVLPAREPRTPVELGSEPPAWFVWLLDVAPRRAHIGIPVSNGRMATIALESQSYDEIAEVWQDFRFVLAATMAYTALLIGSAVLVMNGVFGRIKVIADGLGGLIDGNLDVRVSDLRIRELAVIVGRFNDLARRLRERETENQQLNRRLLTIQDEERRGMARDLHDELGPYLFGLRAATQSVARIVDSFRSPYMTDLKHGVASLADLTQSIQSRTRKLISSLRPMSLGEVPLADLVDDFASTIGRFATEAAIETTASTGANSYGEVVDLTVYRFVQESTVNALRHGGASVIRIFLDEMAEDGKTRLKVTVLDDGRGPLAGGAKPGYGFAGIAERVAALGGVWTAPFHEAGQTTTEIRLPIECRFPIHTVDALPAS